MQVRAAVAKSVVGRSRSLSAMYQIRPAFSHAEASSERDINRLGYELLAEKKPDAAIIIFELNTEAFPGSWNVWDSLGEALAGAGRRPEAIRSYQRALELNPKADSTIDALKRLRGEKD